MKAIVFFTAVLLYCNSCNQSQKEKPKDFSVRIEELIIDENKIGQEYFLKQSLAKGILEYKITYLGNVSCSKEGNLDFVYRTTYSGLYDDSKRANSIIVIYKNKLRFGHYYLGGGFEIIPVILNNELTTKYNDEFCNLTTHINFEDSIPQKIFIHCKDENGNLFGDIYKFERE